MTWFPSQVERVCGVRVDADGDPDPVLGFGVGSRRPDVLARFPDLWRERNGDVVDAQFESSILTVTFHGDFVVSIQLLTPWET